MKAVQFGAGNIGRGFIGLMLSRSGYEVCFAARNGNQVKALQQKKRYKVTFAGEPKQSIWVDGVTGVNLKDRDAVIRKVAEADVVTTAVGASALPEIAEPIARGIEARLASDPRPLLVMACENALSGSALLRRWVMHHLAPQWQPLAESLILFPNTAVDRIVPPQQHADPLAVQVEPYCEWIIERVPLIDRFPAIEGARYVDSLEPFIERKLFTVNTGHSVAAYYGYRQGYRTIQEAMQDADLRRSVERALDETSRLLIAKHGFPPGEHRHYVRKTLRRFENSAIVDKIVRVGRSPLRKLSRNERFVRPALQAHDNGIPVPHLASAIASALLYDDDGDLEAVILQTSIRQRGAGHVIRKHMGIPDTHALHQEILSRYERLKAKASVPSARVR
ncbi:mannitol-1-phosphate 5-dehydrogenase [Cohnella hongkongensis]|uniref:Mannitol-1-phosphate 5-dehydrogenase n=1 Tax=Cohnella hongkongensis TaxID=178337 RepID=A0ABV9FA73_9BACL